MFRLRSAPASIAVTAIAAAAVITMPVTPVAKAQRLFTGDYSTGNFSQWSSFHNIGYHGEGVHFVPTYSVPVVDDPAKGNAARFEVHTGDTPAGMPSGERSEVGETSDDRSLLQQPQPSPACIWETFASLTSHSMTSHSIWAIWIDVVMQAHWSPSDADGWVKGLGQRQRQTFLTGRRQGSWCAR